MTSGAPFYFSLDGGVTNLHSKNNFVTGNPDDLGTGHRTGHMTPSTTALVPA
jgi:hypothetical protein